MGGGWGGGSVQQESGRKRIRMNEGWKKGTLTKQKGFRNDGAQVK